MNEHAKAWVEALRSGEYEQGRMVLRRYPLDQFCCLGVACDLAVKEGVIPKPHLARDAWVYGDEAERSVSALPKTVALWLGVRHHSGVFTDGKDSLALANDSGASFAEIADLIESEPKGLFA